MNCCFTSETRRIHGVSQGSLVSPTNVVEIRRQFLMTQGEALYAVFSGRLYHFIYQLIHVLLL